jgi:hypothetical protein
MWDGLFPIDLPGPEQLAELEDEISQARAGRDDPFNLVVVIPPRADGAPWEAAGATWVLTGFGSQPREAEVREVIEAGPQ